MPYTNEQTAFGNLVANSNDNVMLDALAGTGKTFTLTEFAPANRTLALAFNKSIQLELAKKFPENVTCKTLNGLGHGVLTKQIGRRPSVSTSKIYKLTRAYCEEADEDSLWKSMADIMHLVNLARNSGMLHESLAKKHSSARGLIPDDLTIWHQWCEDDNIAPSLIEPARAILYQSVLRALEGEIDFADQLYIPVVYRGPFPRRDYDTLIIDEAQDLGPLEHHMVAMTLGKSGRLIGAGDPRQAIYGFRGAHTDSMSRLIGAHDATVTPLTITFRCPRAVVREAQRFVPHYTAADSAPEGTVTHWGPEWDITDIPRTATVLCRNNKPLFILAMRLLRQQISCRMEGRDIGANIKRIINDVSDNDDINSRDLIARTDTWRERKTEEALVKGDRAKAQRFNDQAASIIAIAESVSTSGEAIEVINQLFGRDSRGITLSTVHKAKGREWDTVMILDSHLFGQRAEAPWEIEQDNNLFYVAITRSMSRLIYMDSQK